MIKLARILTVIYNFFANIEERLIDEYDGYDKEQNMED